MTTHAPAFAGPVDVAAFGPYGPGRLDRRTDRPVYPFQDRITADGSSGYRAEPAATTCTSPTSARGPSGWPSIRDLAGLQDVVSLSYVDDARDSRGWAFRENRGPDPVNGFTFLAEAYEATEPGYPGHISVPALWDRQTGRVVSNDFPVIPFDLATQFAAFAPTGADLYPEDLRPRHPGLGRGDRPRHQLRRPPGRQGHHPGGVRAAPHPRHRGARPVRRPPRRPPLPVRRPPPPSRTCSSSSRWSGMTFSTNPWAASARSA